MRRFALPMLVVLVALANGCSSSDPGAGAASAGAGGSAAGATGAGAGGASAAGAGSGVAGSLAASGGSPTAVAPTPPAAWVNVTANLAGMASECGNTPYITSNPARDMLLTSVAQHGLWSSVDGGMSWQQLWPTAGSMQITNRGSSIVFDPAHPDTFWESGIYNGPGVYQTTDNGVTFTALGDAHHVDSVSVDLTDPLRMTLLAGGHEQKQTVYRSADGGMTWANVGMNLPADSHFCTNVLVIDKNVHLVGCSGYGTGTDGVYRTTDGGKTWASTSTATAAALPLRASDGVIYWSMIYDQGLIKSTDNGVSWQQTVKYGVLKTVHPIELPDGRIVTAGPKTLMISSDHGVTFTSLGTDMPFIPNSITYSPYRNAFFIEQFDCGNAVVANAISRFGFDYRAE